MRSVLLVVLFFALPSAAAQWVDHGQVEPGPGDLSGRTWPDASASEERVYFNAYPTAVLTGVNVNLARGGTRAPAPVTEFWATLGVWRDCNDDGTIGASEVALLDYPSALQGACPIGSRHNVAGTVRELLPIAETGTTHVWGDRDMELRLCPVTWQPEGTTANAGRFADALDCHLGGPLRALGGPTLREALHAIDLPLHPYDAGSEPGLIQHDDAPAFTVWDCASGAPAPAVRDARGSYATAVEAAFDGAAGDCDASTPTPFHEVFLATDLEPPAPSIDPVGRTATDEIFHYVASERAWLGSDVWVFAPGAANGAMRSPWTFYAHVDPAATMGAALPSATDTTYGAQYCPHGGAFVYECDGDRWYEIDPPDEPWLPRPGDPVTLIDRDCYDLTVDAPATSPWPRACSS